MSSVLRGVLTAVAVVVSLAVLATVVVVFLAPRGAGPTFTRPSDEPLPSWAPPAGSPRAATAPSELAGMAGLVDAQWLDETARATGIPRRALAAYAGAALFKEQDRPECRLDWATLAGIGATESDHGRHGGSSIGDDGFTSPAIFGVALDGNGVALIEDSDAGAIDSDVELDRAVGPMQFIPQAWRNWHVDANGDGIEDPQHIDDAVMAAANYLCRASTAFDTEDGWRTGVRAYNLPEVYLGTVARFARVYAEAASEAGVTPGVTAGAPSTNG